MRCTVEERFWDKVAIAADDDGCWEWQAYKNPAGYGKIGVGGRGKGIALAHRVSWELKFGQIPDGLCVCHVCDNPGCVRPGHLFLGTHKDNMTDMAKKGRAILSHCARGHELSEENCYTHTDGGRRCYLCKVVWRDANRERYNADIRAYRAANREERNAKQRAYRAAKKAQSERISPTSSGQQ